MIDPDIVAAALDLADRGIPVFPCRADNKRPACKRGFYDATIDPAEVRRLFAAAGTSPLIGVPTGEASGFDILDLDPRHGSDPWFNANAERLPATRVHRTRGGGLHFLFRHAPGLRNSAGRIAPGVDVRADGGFAIWWPAHGGDLWLDEPAADWPGWTLAEAVRRQTTASGTVRDAADLAAPSVAAVVDLLERMPNPPGTDRDTYLRVMLGAKGAADGLLSAGLDPAEVDRIADAACGWAARWIDSPGFDAEREKWTDDFALRDAPLAGWRSLEAVAGALLPGYRIEAAVEEFARAPLPAPAAAAGAAEQESDDWESMLLLTDKGGPAALLANALTAMRRAPEWSGVLGTDLFAREVVLLSRPPWDNSRGAWQARPWSNTDPTDAADWLQKRGIRISSAVAHEAAVAAAKSHGFHPVRDYLGGLAWDGTPRADTWLIRHLGVADSALHRAYGRKFLISAVARVMDPGCQVDTVLILEGRQGLRKSTALRALAGSAWFVDNLPDLREKDAMGQLQGVWILEHAEFDKLGRAEAARAKSFISTRVDKFRPSYGRVAESFARQCVFAATINPSGEGYLRDETGARRFWAVRCGAGWADDRKADVHALEAERGQLWAEAVAAYHAGESWWLDSPELETEQAATADERFEADPWSVTIAEILAGKPWTTTAEVMADGRLGLPPKERNPGMARRVANALQRAGWSLQRVRVDGANPSRRYIAPRVPDVPGTVVDMRHAF